MRGVSGKCGWVGLHRVREVDLHDRAEWNGTDQIVQLIGVDVVREDEQGFLDPTRS